MRRVMLVLVLVLSTSVLAEAGRLEWVSVEHQGQIRTARVYVPRQFKAGGAVVFSLHGRYGTADVQMILTHFNRVADKYGFLVVYPNGFLASWNANSGTGESEATEIDDVGFLLALLDQVQSRYRTDPARSYINGMSMGGFMAHRLACESARFTGSASVAGLISPQEASICEPRGPRAVMVIHGTADPMVPFEGGDTVGGAQTLSAPDTVKQWAITNGCDLGQPLVRTVQKGKVTQDEYRGCAKPTVLVTVRDGGHTWPGSDVDTASYQPYIGSTNMDIDASEAIWQFYQRSGESAK